MIRLAGLAVLVLAALVCAGWAFTRTLLSWRQERRRRSVVLSAQREADLREQVARRGAREAAKDAVEDAEYRDPPISAAPATTWVSAPQPRPHPMGWQTVGLTGGVLCAVGCAGLSVDRFDPPSCAWVRVLPEEPLHRQAVEAVGL